MKNAFLIAFIILFLISCNSANREDSVNQVEIMPAMRLTNDAKFDATEYSHQHQAGNAFSGKDEVGVKYYLKNKNIVAPFFNFSFEDAEIMNQEIKSLTTSLVEKGVEADSFMNFEVLYYQDIITALVQLDEPEGISFHSFSLNRESGKRMLADEIFAYVGQSRPQLTEIFMKDREVYWNAVNYQKRDANYFEREKENFLRLLEEELLPAFPDEDGMINAVTVLYEPTGEQYWELYNLSESRISRLLSNAYSREFPLAIIQNPGEEEMRDIKIVAHRKIEDVDKNGYIFIALEDDLSVSWIPAVDEILNRQIQGGEALYVEMSPNHEAEGIIRIQKEGRKYSVPFADLKPKETEKDYWLFPIE